MRADETITSAHYNTDNNKIARPDLASTWKKSDQNSRKSPAFVTILKETGGPCGKTASTAFIGCSSSTRYTRNLSDIDWAVDFLPLSVRSSNEIVGSTHNGCGRSENGAIRINALHVIDLQRKIKKEVTSGKVPTGMRVFSPVWEVKEPSDWVMYKPGVRQTVRTFSHGSAHRRSKLGSSSWRIESGEVELSRTRQVGGMCP